MQLKFNNVALRDCTVNTFTGLNSANNIWFQNRDTKHFKLVANVFGCVVHIRIDFLSQSILFVLCFLLFIETRLWHKYALVYCIFHDQILHTHNTHTQHSHNKSHRITFKSIIIDELINYYYYYESVLILLWDIFFFPLCYDLFTSRFHKIC